MCSKHFKDGEPTEQNPYPSEYLGYDSKRKLKFVSPVLERKRSRKAFDVEPSDELFLPSVSRHLPLCQVLSPRHHLPVTFLHLSTAISLTKYFIF